MNIKMIHIDETQYQDLVQDVLNEIAQRFFSNDEFELKTKTKSWNVMDIGTSQLQTVNFDQSNETLLIKFLIDSFNRANNVRLGPNASEVVKSTVDECKLQSVRHIEQVLLGTYSSSDSINPLQSKLTPFLFTQYISNELVELLIRDSFNKKSDKTFNDVIISHSIFQTNIQIYLIIDLQAYSQPHFILHEVQLVDLRQH